LIEYEVPVLVELAVEHFVESISESVNVRSGIKIAREAAARCAAEENNRRHEAMLTYLL